MKAPKLSRKQASVQSQTRAKEALRKILLVYVHNNCQAYAWARQIAGWIRNSDWPRLYAWAEQPPTEVCADLTEFRVRAQLAALVTKAPLKHLDFGFEKTAEEAAMDKFRHAEEICRKANIRLVESRAQKSRYYRYIRYMRGYISQVLGDLDLQEVYDECGFSTGAALGVHGNATNLFRKMYPENGFTCTPSAKPYWAEALYYSHEQFLLSWMERKDSDIVCYDKSYAVNEILKQTRTVTWNKVSVVPKNAKTGRTIAIEPLANSFLQMGIGNVIRRCLKDWGFDLRDQSKNMALAKTGSVDGSLATLDLSSASDTIAKQLAKLLLPPAWFELLDAVRSHGYVQRVEKRDVHAFYHKFTSMGNGFCFPLETLIFASAVYAVYCVHSLKGPKAVYGDDIIVVSKAYSPLVKLLQFLGFSPNVKKSFNTGPFRESCGADWYEGQDVRPVYLDYPLRGVTSLMIFHNATLRSDWVADLFREIRPVLRAWCPSSARLMRPDWEQRASLERVVDPRTWSWFNALPWDSRLAPIDVKMSANGAFSVPFDVFIGSKYACWNADEQRWSWREFLYAAAPDRSKDKRFQRARYLAFLKGSPMGKLSLRNATTRRIHTI